MDGGTGAAEEIIQGVGNEVFYFFMFLSLLLVIVGAWFSTQVVEPVVSSVILVERTPNSENQRREGENRGELVQYRVEPTDTRPGVTLVSSRSPSSVQENYVTDLQRITEPRRSQAQTESSSSQAPESNRTTAGSSASSQNPANSHQSQEEEPLAPIPEEERVTVRLKFLNDTERDVEASLLENLATFRRRNFTEEISENKNVRFIFNGQMLREESHTLRSYGMFDKCVVHCLISQQAASSRSPGGEDQHQEQQHNAQEEDQDFDLSELFIPVLGFGLIVMWYFAFTYSTYFNSMSTSALLGLTSLFLFTLYGTNVHINVVTRN